MEQVKQAYKKQSLLHHPDKGGSPEAFHRIKVAYQYISENLATVTALLSNQREVENYQNQQRNLQNEIRKADEQRKRDQEKAEKDLRDEVARVQEEARVAKEAAKKRQEAENEKFQKMLQEQQRGYGAPPSNRHPGPGYSQYHGPPPDAYWQQHAPPPDYWQTGPHEHRSQHATHGYHHYGPGGHQHQAPVCCPHCYQELTCRNQACPSQPKPQPQPTRRGWLW